MLNKLCEQEHLVIIILVLLVALLVVGVGKGGGKLLLQLLKKVFGHEEININLPGGDMGRKPDNTSPCMACGKFDAKDCPYHEAEHERSIRNEKGIDILTGDLKATRSLLFGKLETIEGSVNEIKVAVAKLVVVSEYHPARGGKK